MKKCTEHKFFSMTGRCFHCGQYRPEENKFQQPEKLNSKKYYVFLINRNDLYDGSWEVRKPAEKKSKWLPYNKREDAIKRCAKENKKRV